MSLPYSKAALRSHILCGIFLLYLVPSTGLSQDDPASAPPSAEAQAEENTQAQPPAQSASDATNNRIKVTPENIEKLINYGLEKKNWDLLIQLLPYYAQLESKDPILLDYAWGAYYQANGDYAKAINAFRSIIAQKPALLHIRMDLAIMLFENKEYEAAQDQFQKVKAETIPDTLATLIDRYLEAIQKNMSWRYGVGFQILRDNNVNDASPEKYLRIGRYTFQKSEDSLPKKGKGISYSASVGKDFSVTGNHYLTTQLSVNAKNYIDLKEYNQLTGNASIGYKYQTLRYWFSITPSIDRIYFRQQAYGKNVGASFEHGRWLTSNWQAVAYHSMTQKKYDEKPMHLYEGMVQDTGLTFVHLWSPTFAIIMGAHAMRDKLYSRPDSSNKNGVQLGIVKEWSGGISTRVNASYNLRQFNGKHFLFSNKTRRDEEYVGSLTIWHRNLHFWNVTPKINYIYRKVHSNIPEFYSKKNHQTFLSLEKTF